MDGLERSFENMDALPFFEGFGEYSFFPGHSTNLG